ncbi:MAG: alpha-E domain-containing protein [Thermoplasmata archaeon]
MLTATEAYRVFWLGKWLERAEDLARCISLYLNSPEREKMLEPLLDAFHVREAYVKTGEPLEEMKVIDYLVKGKGAGSILHALQMAKENATSVTNLKGYQAVVEVYELVRDSDLEKPKELMSEIVKGTNKAVNAITRPWL